jgi:hypothetical protein
MPIPNLDEHSKKKAKSLVSVHSTGDGKLYAIVTRKFSPDDGSEVDAEVSGVYLEEVDQAIAEAQNKLDALMGFRAELLAAKPMEIK